jgi:uncharacterized protein (DUF1800 family)
MSNPESTIAANRFGLGARPGDLDTIGSDARGWLAAQLRGAPPVVAAGDLQSSAALLAQAAQLRGERAALKRDTKADATPQQASDAAAALMKLRGAYRDIYIAEARTRLVTAVQSERPFVERITQFWSNHFAVSADKVAVLGLAGALEREAIRPRVLGNFGDLLLAVERHPAMLLYLDNQQSTGPGSPLAQRAATRGRQIGLNENLAREILELHTLGANGGYSQHDVTSFANIITGWSVAGGAGAPGGQREPTASGFVFRPMLHEPGAQTLLGKRYAQEGEEQGIAALRDLARTQATARHIATKLARHFIADDPPPAAVERMTQAFLTSDGDLPRVYATLIDSREAWANEPGKFKTPQDYLLSTWRAVALTVPEGNRALAPLELLGQRQFTPRSPAGWPDRSTDWDGSSAILKRIEFADALAHRLGDTRNARELAPEVLGSALKPATRTAIERAASGAQALTLLFTAPEFMRR